MTTRRSAGRNGQRGLTLVELMVTMVVAALVAVSTFAFFVGQRRIYNTQMQILNIQQNLWASMELMARQIRIGGVGMNGCVWNLPTVPSFAPGPAGTIGPVVAPQTGVRLFHPGPLPAGYACIGLGPPCTIRVAPFWIQNGAGINNSDVITIAYGTGGIGNFADEPLGAAVTTLNCQNNIALNGATGALPNPEQSFRADGDTVAVTGDGEWAMLISYDPVSATTPNPFGVVGDPGCSLYYLTTRGALGTGVLNHANGASPPDLFNPPGAANCATFVPAAGYPAGTRNAAPPHAGTWVRDFGTFNWLRFSVQACPAGTGTGNCLMMQRLHAPGEGPQVLAEGIEDMQIAYACDMFTANAADATPNGLLIEGSPALTSDEWMFNAVGENPNANTAPWTTCNAPKAIRITLVARSLTADDNIDPATGNRRPAAEDNPAGANDAFRRRILTTTIYPRNN